MQIALRCKTLVYAAWFSLSVGGGLAQTPVPPPSETAPAQETQTAASPDGMVVGGPVIPPTPAQQNATAWALLATALADTRHGDLRIQALAALGLLDDHPRSLKMIESAMSDRDLDVRTAAVLAAGQSKAPAIQPALRRMLDDPEPQVAYSAALALWKMGDRSGEDILMAVVDGERRASANLLNSTEHDMSRTLHSPSQLAKIGVTEGAGMLLGPFGFGITAYEYIKKNGGDSARVNAIEALAQEHTDPLRKQFLAALADKDPGVRAAAAKALDEYHEPDVAAAIARLFDDPKQPVRLTAAAAYLIATRASAASPKPGARKAAPHRRSQ